MDTGRISIDPSEMLTSSSAFMDAVKSRRSIYALNNTSPISDAHLEQLVKDTMLHVPSAFNSQSTRAVLCLKQEHEKFWDMAKEVLSASAADEEAAKKANGRMDGFKSAYGTIMFFEDKPTIEIMQARTPAYASLFPGWSEHTSGMHQFVLWTVLEAEGFGANLQHYNMDPRIEARAKEMWGLPETWVLKAQLVFGGKKEHGLPPAKEKKSLEETVRVFGK